jgi:hypothetical protein
MTSLLIDVGSVAKLESLLLSRSHHTGRYAVAIGQPGLGRVLEWAYG